MAFSQTKISWVGHGVALQGWNHKDGITALSSDGFVRVLQGWTFLSPGI